MRSHISNLNVKVTLNKLLHFLKLKMPFSGSLSLNNKEQETSSFNLSERKCSRCGQVKSIPENYKRVKYFKSGYSYYCNECDEEMRKTGK